MIVHNTVGEQIQLVGNRQLDIIICDECGQKTWVAGHVRVQEKDVVIIEGYADNRGSWLRLYAYTPAGMRNANAIPPLESFGGEINYKDFCSPECCAMFMSAGKWRSY